MRGRERARLGPAGSRGRGLLVFLATLWLVAYVEELIWDRTIWHDRA